MGMEHEPVGVTLAVVAAQRYSNYWRYWFIIYGVKLMCDIFDGSHIIIDGSIVYSHKRTSNVV